jgi:ribose 5-phosphate isomerase B
MKIFLGSDHRGFRLKEKIAKWLFEWGYEFTDVGAQTYDEEDDYTKYAEKVASVVGSNYAGLKQETNAKCTEVRGILLCGSGVGVDIVANKFDGVRAGIGIDTEQVKQARSDDDMNILVIAADYTKDEEVKDMLKAFLETKFDKKARYKRRLEEITKIEQNN